MPKKKSSRPAASLGSYQDSEPKSSSQIRRERIVKTGAIVIVLALVLSLLAGALSFSPAQAAGFGEANKSVQIQNADVKPIDTDGDGIPNNEDPDIDNDGIVNVNDSDIDGDGISNFDDGDPAATNGFDGKTPNKPGSVSFEELTQNGTIFGWIFGAVSLAGLGIIFVRKTQQKRANNAQKNL
jgi:hypothetical protein